MEIDLSFCVFNDGRLDVIVRDTSNGREFIFTGNQDISSEDFEFINEVAPSCVYTQYKRVKY